MNALARKRELLFAALEQFLNLGDSLADLTKFRQQWPNFFPSDVYDETLRLAQPGQFVAVSADGIVMNCRKDSTTEDSAQPISFADFVGESDIESRIPHFLCGYRNWLRRLWRDPESAPQDWLFWMLGVIPDDRSSLSVVSEIEMPLAASCQFNWKTGRLDYKPGCDFQEALYLLLTSSWRAKTCGRCDRYFIAGKAAQRYCGTNCYAEVKRDRGNDWWQRNGGGWRKSRRTQKRRTAQKRISRRK